MADLLAHIQQAKHNEACAVHLINDAHQFSDWAVTAAFYAAIHLVEACFCTRGDIRSSTLAPDRDKEHEGEHDYRLRKIQELASPAYVDYRELRTASNNVRYLNKRGAPGSAIANQYYTINEVHTLVTQTLPAIRSHLSAAFGVKLD